jgi:hypothetical protein
MPDHHSARWPGLTGRGRALHRSTSDRFGRSTSPSDRVCRSRFASFGCSASVRHCAACAASSRTDFPAETRPSPEGPLGDEAKRTANERIQRFDATLTTPFLLGVRPEQIGDVVTRGSFFGELSHTTAYASCASAVQALRNGFRTYRDGGIVDVVDLPMVLEAYFETVFPAAVLRTSHRAQLWNPNGQNELGRDIERLDIRQAYPGTVAELALAAAIGKVPHDAVLRLVERALQSSHDPHFAMLKEVIRLNVGT